MAKKKFKIRYRLIIGTIAAFGIFPSFAVSCGQNASPVTSHAPINAQGQSVGSNTTECRVPQQYQAALTTTLNGTISNTNTPTTQTQAFQLKLFPYTLKGYTGTFLAGTFTSSGSLGNFNFDMNFCSETVGGNSPVGVTITGMPVRPDHSGSIGAASLVRVITGLSIPNSQQVDPSRSLMNIMDCGTNQACSNPSAITGVSESLH